MVFVCSGVRVRENTNKSILNLIRRLDRNGAIIGAICTGTYVMAAAGLLDGRRCTIHWENIDGLAEEFPHLDITNDLFEIDGNRVTCSGGTASLDMMLNLITQTHGSALAAEVSDQFIHDRIREPTDRQRMELRARLGVSHPKLLAVVKTMEDNLEEPLAQTDIARMTNLSTRQLETIVPQISGHHPNPLLSEFAACPCAPSAAPDINVNSIGSFGLRICLCIAFFKMLPRMLWADTTRRTQPRIDATRILPE